MIKLSLKKLSDRITDDEIESMEDCYQLALVIKREYILIVIDQESIEYHISEFNIALQDFMILKKIMEKKNE